MAWIGSGPPPLPSQEQQQAPRQAEEQKATFRPREDATTDAPGFSGRVVHPLDPRQGPVAETLLPDGTWLSSCPQSREYQRMYQHAHRELAGLSPDGRPGGMSGPSCLCCSAQLLCRSKHTFSADADLRHVNLPVQNAPPTRGGSHHLVDSSPTQRFPHANGHASPASAPEPPQYHRVPFSYSPQGSPPTQRSPQPVLWRQGGRKDEYITSLSSQAAHYATGGQAGRAPETAPQAASVATTAPWTAPYPPGRDLLQEMFGKLTTAPSQAGQLLRCLFSAT